MMAMIEGVARQIRDLFPDIKWDLLEEVNRAANWELWWGPLPDEYWTEAEPLELYVWQGFEKACDDIREILEDLPYSLWLDQDSDCISDTDPELFDEHWVQINDHESLWVGGEWTEFRPHETMLSREVFRHIYC
jgi:hypothetical protein